MRRIVFLLAGVFLIFQSLYTTMRLIQRDSLFLLAAVAPALLAAFALGWLLVLRNFRAEKPTTPEEDS